MNPEQKNPEIGRTPQPIRILLVEDNPADCQLVLRELRVAGFEVTSEMAQTPEQFRECVLNRCPDIVLADYNLGQWRGIEALTILRELKLEVPLILVSGALGDLTAVDCIKRGATDYVLKDALARLPVCIRRALDEKRLHEQRRQAEKELAHKVEELARSNRDLEQFAYVASHDLQEPLRMVAAYTQLLAERYSGKLDEKADKYIHYAVDGALRMQTLVQDLLAFSRAGREGTEMQKVDCNDLVRSAMVALEASIRESNANISFDRLPMLRANRAQLQQVFQNLIANAIKFRGSETPNIEISAKSEGQEWVLLVRDNGIGIPAENSDQIFVIFQRLHTRAEYPGNGIGLSICKRIIERHGGKIWVDSKQGNGATFSFTLSAEESQPAAMGFQRQIHPEIHPERRGYEETSRSAVSG
jgi:two-component system, sensor histidine kinase and response regulator